MALAVLQLSPAPVILEINKGDTVKNLTTAEIATMTDAEKIAYQNKANDLARSAQRRLASPCVTVGQ